MQPKDFGLLVALSVLIGMAVFTEKRILVAEGYAFTKGDLAQGRLIYDDFCLSCHGIGEGGAPLAGDDDEWRTRLKQGMGVLIAHAVEGFRGEEGWMPPKGGHAELSIEEVSLAVAYMIAAGRER